MNAADPRLVLARLSAEQGASYAALSRMLRRNDAYLQQYVKRGTPRVLGEQDRRMLAGYFRVDEALLGGPATDGATMVPIRRLDLAASAGPGAVADDEVLALDMPFDPALLARLRVAPDAAAVLAARGDSMIPTIADGDLMLVDERDRRITATPAIFVLRLDGALLVKRLSKHAGLVTIESDNPATAPLPPQPSEAVTIVGRVVWLSRALR